MKIVCLIKPEPALIYFANKINEEFPLMEVVLENPNIATPTLFSKLMKRDLKSGFEELKRRMFQKKYKKVEYSIWFGDKWQILDGNIPCMHTDNINSDVVFDRVNEFQPDLILDHGTSIVKDRILQNSKLALNLHWGLSPYYRGTHCTEWALINWDPYNIGVTIHKLTRDIDGGNILAQKRVDVKPSDSLQSINMQLTYLGTELVLEAVRRLANGETLNFRRQDFSLGYLTYLRQWNHLLDEQIIYMERNNMIEMMLKYPSRIEKLPIVEMGNDNAPGEERDS